MIILCGPSATGKTEIAKLLTKQYGIKKVVTTTTRPMRVNEVNDVDYHFVSKEKFLSLLDKDFFVEHVEYNNNFYGCGKDEVQDNKVVILEPEGVKNFLKLNNPNIVTIVLFASEEVRKNRMLNRLDNIDDINKRLLGDKKHFSEENLSFSDFIINTENKTIEEITKEVYESYISKKNKTR